MAACLGLVGQFVGQCGEEKSKIPYSWSDTYQMHSSVLLDCGGLWISWYIVMAQSS